LYEGEGFHPIAGRAGMHLRDERASICDATMLILRSGASQSEK